MRADLKLLPRLLIHMRRSQHCVLILHRGQRNRPRNLCPSAPRRFHNLARRLIQNAVVVSLQPDANSFFSNHVSLSLTPPGVSGRKEPAARSKPQHLSCHPERDAFCLAKDPCAPRDHLAFFARMQNRAFGALPYCTISEIVPAPTVCPPSRMANRKPFSIATGVINSITSETLSPGITISVPAGSSATPVTSVVRR